MNIARISIDRRSARTRATLQHALMSLILKKGYEAITIKDICDAADVGRSTFYMHYKSKDDLKRGGLESLRRVLVARQKDALTNADGSRGPNFAFSLAMFEHARDHIAHYRSLGGSRGGTVALASIRAMLSDLVREELAATGKNPADAIPLELAVQHTVGAYMAVLTWWLDGGAKLPPQQIDTMFRRLAIEGLKR